MNQAWKEIWKMKQTVKITLFLIIYVIGVPVLSGTAAVPVIRVDAENKTANQIGTALGNQIKAKFPDIDAKIDIYLESYVSQDMFNYMIRRRLDAIRSGINRKYRDEVRSMASLHVCSDRDRLGDGHLSLNEFWFFQLIPDIGRQNSCSGFGVFDGCSASGAPIVGRNLDWHTNKALRSIQAITVYEYGKRVLVNIGFAGYVGVVSGFNDKGLFAAHLDSSLSLPYPDSLRGMHSAVFDIRNALETAGSISRAASLMAGQRYPFSHNVLLADRKDVQVLEQARRKVGKLRTAYSPLRGDISWGKPCQIAVVNFFALKGNSNGVREVRKWNRFKCLANFSRKNKAHVGDVINIMLDRHRQRIFNERTVQSMVFTPDDRKLYLYTMPASGVHPRHPVIKEVKGLISAATKENPPDNGNLPVIFLLVFGVPAGVLIYYKWESGLKRKLSVYDDDDDDDDEREKYP